MVKVIIIIVEKQIIWARRDYVTKYYWSIQQSTLDEK